MTVGSLFAGIGGFDLGFERAGFQVLWQVERDEDCQAVLTKRFPDVRRELDINAFAYGRAKNRLKHGLVLPSVDVIVGGFPCQDVSVAGQRKGLSGSRSGLFFAFMRILALLKPQPTGVVIENVPGLFTSQCGRDFHAVLSALAERGFRRSYRVLDSQYFGVPQRRRRVFLVGCLRTSDLDPAAILFESVSRSGNSQAGQQARARVASTLRGRSAKAGVNEPGRGGEDDSNLILFDWQTSGSERSRPNISSTHSSALQTTKRDAVAYTLRENGRNTSQGPANYVSASDDSGERARALVGSMHKRHDDDTDTLIPTLDRSLGHHRGAVGVGDFCVPTASALLGRDSEGLRRDGMDNLVASPITASAGHHGHSSARGDGRDNLIAAILNSAGNDGGFRTEPGEHLVPTLQSKSGRNQIEEVESYQPTPMGVRRLTPLECERLQGFPDGWTCLCGEGHRGTQFCSCPDTPRYKQLGNAVSVPVAQWIAERILDAEGHVRGRSGETGETRA